MGSVLFLPVSSSTLLTVTKLGFIRDKKISKMSEFISFVRCLISQQNKTLKDTAACLPLTFTSKSVF